MVGSRWGELTWQELEQVIKKSPVVLVPVGQIEQHGWHLPVETDAFLAEVIATKLAETMSQEMPILVIPTIWTGYSTAEVTRWPGCLNLRLETFMALLEDVCSSLIKMGLKKFVLISTHGNHTGALEVVARKMADLHKIYLAVTIPSVIAKKEIESILEKGKMGSCHAGEYETSLMLYLAEDKVKKESLTNEDILRWADWPFYGQVFVSTWGMQKSLTGTYGDPTAATAEKGRRIFESILKAYQAFLRDWGQR
ncbi:MAG: creatininase family protein [Candidatus Omnitrophica bacterium]|nr:creatininase family protein [Candidatus Omnitrophota bacterium]